MLKEIKGLDEVIQHAVFFADWVWNSYDKPGKRLQHGGSYTKA